MPHIDCSSLEAKDDALLIKEVQAKYLMMTHTQNPELANRFTVSPQVFIAEINSVPKEQQVQSLHYYCDSALDY